MTTIVHVAIPVTKTRTQFTLLKGRPWSVVEHLLLEAIERASRTMRDLEEGFQLRRPIVVTGLMRLMRAQWVQVRSTEAATLFAITGRGREALSSVELPYSPTLIKTERIHLYERLTGHVFRQSELRHFGRDKLIHANPSESVVEISDHVLPEGYYCIDEVSEVLLEEDEQEIGIRPGTEHYSDKVALITVANGKIVDLPEDRNLEDLKTRIHLAAQSVTSNSTRVSWATGLADEDIPRTNAIAPVDIVFKPEEDLVIGAQAHKDAILDALTHARSRVIIHSTFLSWVTIEKLIQPMIKAAERDVVVDILWGQEEKTNAPRNPQKPTAADIVRMLSDDPKLARYRDRLRFNTQSTRSHAKVIVFDPEQVGEHIVLLGSCNWLASGYDSIEASVYLRGTIVCQVLNALARAVHAGSGTISLLTEELLQMARTLRTGNATTGANGKAAIVIDDAHNDCMIRARDEAKRRVLLTSHRMGPVARPGALVPLAVACGGGKVKANVVYGRLDGIKSQLASQWRADAQRYGVALEAIEEPRVHAKLLAWDEDTVVISSQNWLSADPNESHIVRELGVIIDAPGAGAITIKLFNSCLKAN